MKIPPRQSVHQPKQKKKRNKFITCLALVGALALAISFLFGISTGDENAGPVSPMQNTPIPKLVVQAGSLSQYKSQITEDTIINVYKKDGSLDERDGDLKELCLDWLYYTAKIQEYVASGDNEKADEARENFKQVNSWLDDYDESDVQMMFTLIEENHWSKW